MPDSLLRVLTCGSVDDGKSTLIGRLLFECGTIPDDVMAALERDSRRFGTVEGGIDYALLVDGLAAEREQGVTIDVAYRFFETARRRFILADTPGHHQYTRNMVTGASTADLAILLVDARKGLLVQTRRHAAIASLAGHPPGGAGGQQDGPGRLRAGGVRRHRRGFRCAARPAGRVDASPPFRSSPATATTSPAPARACPGTPAPRCWRRWKTRESATDDARVAVPHAGAIRQPPGSRLPRLLRQHRRRHAAAGRRGGERAVRGWWRRSRASSRWMATWRRRMRALPVTLVLDREIDVSRGDVLAARHAAGAGRPDRRLGGLDGRDAAVPRPRLSVDAGHAQRDRARSPTSRRGWMSTR